MEFSKLGRLWRTIRPLKPVQVIWRGVFRLYSPRPDVRVPGSLRHADGPWVLGAARRASLIGAHTFQIFGTQHCVSDGNWNPDGVPKLLCYNLHYFDDLNAKGATDRLDWHRDLITHWIDTNPSGSGNGWEPYPLSLRIVNWIKWSQHHPDADTDQMRHSLAIQTRFLRQRLEWHLLGNHLFVNAKALIFAGLYFDGAEATTWRKIGFAILKKQIPEQILKDGGQFERSPMYHALALEDMLDLIAITRRYANALTPAQHRETLAWVKIISSMMTAMDTMLHPDDQLSFFNDTAFGIAPDAVDLRAYAARLRIQTAPLSAQPFHALPDTGYHRLQRGSAVVIIDAAPIGPTYLPGHAHADSLSFELSLGIQRVIVNGGISQYGADLERHRQRGTAAHSTLCLAGQDSSEVWGGFRVGRRAHVFDITHHNNAEETSLTASHDGYSHLPGHPIHRRSWTLQNNSLNITDRIIATHPHPAEIFFHLHPDLTVTAGALSGTALVSRNGDPVAHFSVGDPVFLKIITTTWHPKFGVALPSQSICITPPMAADMTVTSTLNW